MNKIKSFDLYHVNKVISTLVHYHNAEIPKFTRPPDVTFLVKLIQTSCLVKT